MMKTEIQLLAGIIAVLKERIRESVEAREQVWDKQVKVNEETFEILKTLAARIEVLEKPPRTWQTGRP